MIKPRTAVALFLGFAVAGVVASPAQTQALQHGHAARAQASGGEMGPDGLTQHRATAMRACNERANRYSQPTHGNMQSYTYWSCMTMRGEPD